MISKNPICIYWWEVIESKDAELGADLFSRIVRSELHFHEDYPSSTQTEFCYYVVLPRIKELQENTIYKVSWGFVNDSGQTVDEMEATLKNLLGIKNEKARS